MNKVTQTNNNGGIGFAGALTLLFVALKLTGFIAWSWWWVLSPLWISAAIAFLIITIALLIVAVVYVRS